MVGERLFDFVADFGGVFLLRRRELFEKIQLYAVASVNGLEDNLMLVSKSKEEKEVVTAFQIEVKHDRAKLFSFVKANIPAGAVIMIHI